MAKMRGRAWPPRGWDRTQRGFDVDQLEVYERPGGAVVIKREVNGFSVDAYDTKTPQATFRGSTTSVPTIERARELAAKWMDDLTPTRQVVLGRARWTTRGKGFGRATGWVVPGEAFFPQRGSSMPKGAVGLGKDRMLDLQTGEIYRTVKEP